MSGPLKLTSQPTNENAASTEAIPMALIVIFCFMIFLLIELQTEQSFIGAHSINQQTEVLKQAAGSLGKMGTMDFGGNVNGMNPAAMMTGMAMGGAVGGQMAGMMNQMGQNMSQAMNTLPPPPQIQYYVSVNGQNAGPFNMQQLQQMTQCGQLTRNTYVWKNGMQNWEFAENIQELSMLFGAIPPPPPMP